MDPVSVISVHHVLYYQIIITDVLTCRSLGQSYFFNGGSFYLSIIFKTCTLLKVQGLDGAELLKMICGVFSQTECLFTISVSHIKPEKK